ncbi:MAG: hypothetical protein K2X38_06205 [Gemmataceae bacterium]|nr:hypothetical protein [Gemmataceae bacterium]
MMRGMTIACLCLAAAGCVPTEFYKDPETAQVSSNHFGLQAPPGNVTRASYMPSTNETLATRVDAAGRKVLNANPQIGQKTVLFATIGNPQPEIFHVTRKQAPGVGETPMVFVTEGLANLCKTDNELAAVLAFELGRMVAKQTPTMEKQIAMPLRAEIGGSATSRVTDDPLYASQLARVDAMRKQAAAAPQRPDPQALARVYLENAGFGKNDIDTVQPYLQMADRNCAMEKQLKGTVAPNQWTP